MEQATTGPSTVLVFAGPGLGHYLPIATFLQELDVPARVIICAEITSDHPMVERIEADGFRFESVQANAGRRTDRPLRAATRALRQKFAPALARRARDSANLPTLAARWVFAIATQCTPLVGPRRPYGDTIDDLLVRHRPALVLGEMHDVWLSHLTKRRGIPHIVYTTGPVGDPRWGRPLGPTGLSPQMNLAERVVNTSIWGLRQLRRRREGFVFRRATQVRSSVEPRGAIRHVAFTAPSLDDYPESPQRRYDYVGVSPYRRAGWPDDIDQASRDTVVFTWGTTGSGALDAVIDCLVSAVDQLAQRHRVVVQTDRSALRSRLEALNTTVEVVGSRGEPLHEEYRRALAVVCHGGYGTINEAVAWGAPVVVNAEMVADRMETSQRVLHAGVGTSLDFYTLHPDALVAAVDHVAGDPEVRRRVRLVGAELRDRRPREAVLDRLRALLTSEISR